jgi:FtsP/CotA-like multicopper oxidase with cupredoxin domain
VIQDRSFNTDGSLAFSTAGDNPGLHPYWMPEFFGDAIMVNGKVWPNLNVEIVNTASGC